MISPFLVAALFHSAAALHYKPDVNQRFFSKGDSVSLKYNSMTSTNTFVPLDPYTLPICQPEGGPRLDNENLGEFLQGDRIQSSPIDLWFMEDMYCRQICITNLGRMEVPGISPNNVVKAIQKHYHHDWIVDNLPAASVLEDDTMVVIRYWQGFPLGYRQDGELAYVHNHFNIEIMYTPAKDKPGSYSIVRFTVEPFSIAHEFEPHDYSNIDSYSGPEYARIKNPIESCKREIPLRDRMHTNYDMIHGGNGTAPQIAAGHVLFTYDVRWIQNIDLDWDSRWDIYLTMDNAIPERLHWFPAVFGILLIIILSGFLSCIPIMNLSGSRKPTYASVSTGENGPSNTGWKALHSEVFRPPECFPVLFCVACGTGAQLFCATMIVVVMACLGYLSPARRGSLGTAEIFFYCLSGYVGGYVTSTLDRTFHAEGGRRAALQTAFIFPGMSFMVFVVVDAVEWGSSGISAIGNNHMTYVILLFLWCILMLPLTLLGARHAVKAGPIDFPVETSTNLPRRIPPQPCILMKPIPLILGGIFPFAISFVELYFCTYSMWFGYYYAEYGFLLWALVVVFISTSQTAMLHTFFLLKKENYRWWWRSFFTGASAALWAGGYILVVLPMDFALSGWAAQLKYTTLSVLLVIALVMMSGSFAVGACLSFNKALYKSIKDEIGNVEARIELLTREDHDNGEVAP